MTPLNALRHRGPGHLESYFLRANDPTGARALWLKATVLAPLDGPPIAETWLVWFDGDKGRVLAQKASHPLEGASFPKGASPGLDVGGWRWRLAAEGSAEGAIATREGPARFSLTWTRFPSTVAAPLCLYPAALLKGRFPRFKLVSPSPWLRVAGVLELPGERVELANWEGMQGHNWGPEQAYEYAWGQCVFPPRAGAPETMVEGLTARIRLAGRPSPPMSLMVVRRGSAEYRFDRVLDLWRQEPHLEPRRWTVRMRSHDAEARLRLDATDRPLACLGYANPDGRVSYCFNSKLADAHLEVRPRNAPAFTCESPHGGALEFLRQAPEPGLEVV